MRNTSKHQPTQTICIDLEFSYGRKKLSQIKIYEIGAVRLDEHGVEIDSFQTYVKQDGDYCPRTLNFLGLEREIFNNSPALSHALEELNKFVFKDKSYFQWCSWGDFDFKLLQHKLKLFSDSDTILKNRYYDAQREFHCNVPSARQKTSLQEAVEDYCDDYIANHHSALSDARALSKIVSNYCM